MVAIIIISLMPLRIFKSANKKQKCIDKLILYKFLEINMIATPHFYIIAILIITIRLFLLILYLLLTRNIEKVFNGFPSLPTIIFNDTISALNKIKIR